MDLCNRNPLAKLVTHIQMHGKDVDQATTCPHGRVSFFIELPDLPFDTTWPEVNQLGVRRLIALKALPIWVNTDVGKPYPRRYRHSHGSRGSR